MHPEHCERLIAAFPHLYRRQQPPQPNRRTDPGSTFTCGDGWFELLWQLSARLEQLIVMLPEEEQGYCGPAEVKEKWGRLRLDMGYSTQEMDELLLLAEEQSSHICEVCGAPGTLLKRGGWLMTCCLAHDPQTNQPQ